MQSAFDPKTFGQMTFNEANSTEYVPHPEGDDFIGLVTKVEPVGWSSKDGDKSGLKLKVTIETEDPRVAEATGRPKNVITDEIMLDLTPDNTGLDFGKGMNVRLGRFREAIGLNVPGQPWSFDMMPGRPVKYGIKHRMWEGKPQADVKGYLKP